jgi:hypothetical protein
MYTSLINITDMAFVYAYKMNDENVVQLDLIAEFAKGRRQKVELKDRVWCLALSLGSVCGTESSTIKLNDAAATHSIAKSSTNITMDRRESPCS